MKKIYLSLIIAATISASVSWATTDNTNSTLFQESKIEAQVLDDQKNIKEIQSKFDDNNFSMTIHDGLRYRESIDRLSEQEQKQYLKDLKAITSDYSYSKDQFDKESEKYSKEGKRIADSYSFFMERKAERINDVTHQMIDKRYILALYKIEADTKRDSKNLQVKNYVKLEDSVLNSEYPVKKTLGNYGTVTPLNALGFNQALIGQVGSSQFSKALDNKIIDIKYQYVFFMDGEIPYLRLDIYNQSDIFLKINTKVRLDDYKNHIVNITQIGDTSYLLVLEEQ